MEYKNLLQELESLGTAQNRNIYRRHGVSDNQFGVSVANLRKLQKQIKRDHSLAKQLWVTGNHDCRVLATMIADPSQADDALLEGWAKDLSNYVITDAFAGYVSQTSSAREKAENWRRSDGEWTGRAGWLLLAQLAMKDPGLPNSYFADLLETIERDIHSQKNRVKDSMNSALIAIGIRNSELERLALAAAQRIGKVEVDHGETGCQTPEAAEYIRRTLQRREQKRAKAS
jgi:3-methyladenine DNA glycosylase AlkD